MTEDASIFREPIKIDSRPPVSPQEAPQKPTEQVTDSKPVEMPPSLYQEAKKTPYLLSLFEAPEIYKQFDVKSQADEIDSFINSEIKRRELDDNKDNYKKVLDALYKHIKMTDDHYTNIENLLEWVRIQRKLVEVAQEELAFKQKPVDEMSVSEIKRFLHDPATR